MTTALTVGDGLRKAVVGIVDELPGSEIYAFTPEWDAARVSGKWFALFSAVDGEGFVNLKVDPLEGRWLRERYDEITPGYHMNKTHWITVRPGPALTSELVRELVVTSYLLVVEGLPKKRRPKGFEAVRP